MPATFVDIDPDRAGQRIDNYLLSVLKGVPKSKIYNIIRKGEVRVNKGRVQPSYKLAAGDRVRIPPIRQQSPDAVQVSASLTSLLSDSVLFEDEGWLVINKPNELAVHGGSGLALGLIEALRQIRDEPSLELCHRLDKATSGCVVLARKRSSLKRFHAALRDRQLTKVYQAIVAGQWSTGSRMVNLALHKNVLASGERMVKVSADGKPSRTEFEVLQKLNGFTRVEARPITGRTHQIRVHCQAQGHAIVGDSKYGQRVANERAASAGYRQLFLHASSISLPIGPADSRGRYSDTLTVDSPLPEFWQDFMAAVSR